MKNMSLPKFTSPSEEELEKARKKVFYGNGMYIFRSVINREDALKIKDLFLIKNPEIFSKSSDGGNHRLFFYPESPFYHPPFVKFLWEQICDLRNNLYEGQPWFESYKERNGLKHKNSTKILDFQRKHNWSCFYWYKKNESHYKHIDEEGELACFLILSEKGRDYLDGGLYVYRDESDTDGILADSDYNLGDLVIFDQSRFYHEVKNLEIGNGIGRFQFYIPNIPDGRINNYLTFEGSNKVYFSKPTNFLIRTFVQFKQLLIKDEIHYSRKAIQYIDKKSPEFNI